MCLSWIQQTNNIKSCDIFSKCCCCSCVCVHVCREWVSTLLGHQGGLFLTWWRMTLRRHVDHMRTSMKEEAKRVSVPTTRLSLVFKRKKERNAFNSSSSSRKTSREFPTRTFNLFLEPFPRHMTHAADPIQPGQIPAADLRDLTLTKGENNKWVYKV